MPPSGRCWDKEGFWPQREEAATAQSPGQRRASEHDEAAVRRGMTIIMTHTDYLLGQVCAFKESIMT